MTDLSDSAYFIIPEEINHIPTTEEITTERDQFIIEQKIKEMFNDICILIDTSLVRLVGFGSDTMDFYYICKDIDGRIIRMTAVGSIFSLKNSYPRYQQMEHKFNINRCPRETQFILEHIDND